jgi:hypothetical protein
MAGGGLPERIMRTLKHLLCALGLVSLVAVAGLAAFVFSGGGNGFHTPFREQKLPSGRMVKVTAAHLAWPDEHGPPGQQADFEMEFVSANPAAAPEARAQEAREVFELIRPTAELWGMDMAVVSGFPGLVRKGKYDLYVFKRKADGSWGSEHQDRKVFATD